MNLTIVQEYEEIRVVAPLFSELLLKLRKSLRFVINSPKLTCTESNATQSKYNQSRALFLFARLPRDRRFTLWCESSCWECVNRPRSPLREHQPQPFPNKWSNCRHCVSSPFVVPRIGFLETGWLRPTGHYTNYSFISSVERKVRKNYNNCCMFRWVNP